MHLSWRASPVSEQILHKEQHWKISPNPESQQENRNTECSNRSLIHKEESLAPSPVFTPEYQIYITEGQAGGVSAGVNLDPPTAVFDNGSGSLRSTWWSLASWVVPVLCEHMCIYMYFHICIYSEGEYEPIMCDYGWRLSLIFILPAVCVVTCLLPWKQTTWSQASLCWGNVLGTWKASGLPPGSIFPSMETGSILRDEGPCCGCLSPSSTSISIIF